MNPVPLPDEPPQGDSHEDAESNQVVHREDLATTDGQDAPATERPRRPGWTGQPKASRLKHPRIAFSILLLGVMNENAWKLVGVDIEGHVWSGTNALLRLWCLFLIGLFCSSAEVWLVIALIGGFAAQNVACTAWYLVSPWPTPPGSELCSAKLHFPVGLVGLWAVLCVVWILNHKGSKP